MSYFATIGRVIGNLKGFYSGINSATLTGAIDVIVVEQPDGTFKCSPFHVRFGKLGVLRSKEKVVDIEINGKTVPLRMKLGDSGEAFFVQEFEDEDDVFDENLATSPLPGSPRMNGEGSPNGSKKGDTDVSECEGGGAEGGEEVKPILTGSGSGDVAITIVEDEAPTDKKESDVKSRRRRKKRRKNHSCDIKPENIPQMGDIPQKGVIRSDKDLQEVVKAVKEMGIGGEGGGGPLPMNRSFHRDVFSDTEVDMTHGSRPSTPVQSDTEYECKKGQKSEDEEVGKWVWGELPTTAMNTPVTTPSTAQVSKVSRKASKKREEPVSSDDEGSIGKKAGGKSSMFSMFNFMKRENNQEAQSVVDGAAEGIYLDDLNLDSMDPETAALYFPSIMREQLREFPKPEHDDDGESGKGCSLPQSPVPGSSPTTSDIDSHMEEHARRHQEPSPASYTGSEPSFEAISLCGNNLALFEQSRITFDQLIENPEIILNASPDAIVVKLNGKLIPWTAALPQLLSTTFFQRPLPSQVFQTLVDQCTKKEDPEAPTTAPSSSSPNRSESGKKSYGSWFPWRRSQIPPGNPEDPGSSPESKLDHHDSSPGELSPGKSRKDLSASFEGAGPSQPPLAGQAHTKDPSVSGSPPTSSNGDIPEKFKKCLRLSTEELVHLGLNYGQNEAIFSVTTAYQGTTVARCHIYLWKWDDRVVISDIDGTITKSDVLGHILPIIGNDWAQSGVAQLFTQIHANGYKMLYLSARAIGQAAITREYLRSIKQGEVTLPDGPLLLNPTSLMSALHREVIEKKPEEFKIACLKDIQTLFPENPFYAGYGNKINDVWSYRAVDINISRIFTINHKGELRHALTNSFQSSYPSLVELAEHIFPPYKSTEQCCQADGFTSFEFWRLPIATLTPNNSSDEDSPTKDSRARALQRSNTIA